MSLERRARRGRSWYLEEERPEEEGSRDATRFVPASGESETERLMWCWRLVERHSLFHTREEISYTTLVKNSTHVHMLVCVDIYMYTVYR